MKSTDPKVVWETPADAFPRYRIVALDDDGEGNTDADLEEATSRCAMGEPAWRRVHIPRTLELALAKAFAGAAEDRDDFLEIKHWLEEEALLLGVAPGDVVDAVRELVKPRTAPTADEELARLERAFLDACIAADEYDGPIEGNATWRSLSDAKFEAMEALRSHRHAMKRAAVPAPQHMDDPVVRLCVEHVERQAAAGPATEPTEEPKGGFAAPDEDIPF